MTSLTQPGSLVLRVPASVWPTELKDASSGSQPWSMSGAGRGLWEEQACSLHNIQIGSPGIEPGDQ